MPADRPLAQGRILIYRHPIVVRVTHWVNVASMLILLLSGLQILCSHPAFYWGEVARFAHPFAEVTSDTGPKGEPRGWLAVMGMHLDTTGLLGASRSGDGQLSSRAFPRWLTLPSDLDLGAGRRWHFFFAWVFSLNGLIYLSSGFLSRRFRRELVPSRNQLAHLGDAILSHLQLRFDQGEDARHYNVLQKLAYLPVIFVLLPLMVVTGLAMSPAIDARFHFLTIGLGGRQSARTLHFLSASGLVAFVVVHVAMVIVAGPLNELRSMITGWFVIRPRKIAP